MFSLDSKLGTNFGLPRVFFSDTKYPPTGADVGPRRRADRIAALRPA